MLPPNAEFWVNKVNEHQQQLSAATALDEKLQAATDTQFSLEQISREVDRHGLQSPKKVEAEHKRLLRRIEGHIDALRNFIQSPGIGPSPVRCVELLEQLQSL